MEEFLRSHAGLFVMVLASSVPFYMVARGSLLQRWQPKVAALGVLILALLMWVTWVVGNQVATFILAALLFNSFLLMLVGWLRRAQTT